MKSILAYIKGHYIIVALAVAVILAVATGAYVKLSSNGKLETVSVTRQKIVQSVAVTGKVKPSAVADLAFEKSGTVGRIYADVGAQVKTGDIIVALKSADLYK